MRLDIILLVLHCFMGFFGGDCALYQSRSPFPRRMHVLFYSLLFILFTLGWIVYIFLYLSLSFDYLSWFPVILVFASVPYDSVKIITALQ